MDLSGLIFVVLAVAWAGYLIPRALRHHEEIAANRPVDSFSDTVRVLERTPSTMRALLTPPSGKVPGKRTKKAPKSASPKTPAPARPTTRSTARGAARRRRRVLLLLLLVTAATAGVAAFHYLPWVYVAIPGALVLGWLVLCRLMVRKTHVGRRTPVVEQGSLSTLAPETELVSEPSVVEEVAPAGTVPVETDLDDDGSLWDPLPLTLPTYVTKPAARRTVRTIDLTQTGVTSSGHKAEDSKLARAAEADATAAESTEHAAEEAQQRKAAGA
ncbi:MAG: divisome protein SepX/GlpR [Marmoricola sp.]